MGGPRRIPRAGYPDEHRIVTFMVDAVAGRDPVIDDAQLAVAVADLGDGQGIEEPDGWSWSVLVGPGSEAPLRVRLPDFMACLLMRRGGVLCVSGRGLMAGLR